MILLRSRCPSYIAQQAKDRAACLQQRPAGRMLVRTDKYSVDCSQAFGHHVWCIIDN